MSLASLRRAVPVLLASFVLLTSGDARAAARAVGYYGSWSIYARDYQVAEIPAAALTHVNYAFADVSPAGECALFDPWADVEQPYPGDGAGAVRGNFRQLQILKDQYPHLRTLISIGGWTLSGRFSDVAATAAARDHFATSCVAFMRQYGFDGIDVDWEFPVSGGLPENVTRPEDEQNYTLLLAALRGALDTQAALDGRPYLLTIDAPAVPEVWANFDLAAMHSYLDWIGIMAYDLNGPWSPRTHFHSMLHVPSDAPAGIRNDLSGSTALDAYAAAGVPPHKLVLGVPFYGRGWKGVPATRNGLFQSHTGVPPGTYEDGVFDYRDLAANYFGHTQRFFHTGAAAPWLYDLVHGIMIAYDDPESIAAKAAYVDASGFGGLMFWELSQDDDAHTLVDAAATGLHANCDPTPRAGCDAPAKSTLQVKNGKLGWGFQKGTAAVAVGDFGVPTTTTTYTLCLYDHGARILQAKLPPGAAWRPSGVTGFGYKAKDGITRVVVKGGAAGKPKVQVKGRGALVTGIPTPMAAPVDVTIQLVHDAGARCWADTYTSVTTNVAGAFKAANR